MRTLLQFFFIGILFCSACSQHANNRILSEERMENLMLEVHILDAYLSSLPFDSARMVNDTLNRQLLKKYDLDSASFSDNMIKYFSDPKKTEDMYDDIYKRLFSRERELFREDSLRNVILADSLKRVDRLLKDATMRDRIKYTFDKTDSALTLIESNENNLKNIESNLIWHYDPKLFEPKIINAKGLVDSSRRDSVSAVDGNLPKTN